MAQRPKVPTALHSELTEYSSLLRALRTTDTLDLTKHLAEPPPTSLQAISDLDDISLSDEDLYEPIEEPPATESVSHELTSNVDSSVRSGLSSARPRRTRRSGKAKQRDTWTRWPLLAGDVLVPEWGLYDEVRQAAEEALEVTSGPSAASQPDLAEGGTVHDSPASSDYEEMDDDHPVLSPIALRALTADSSAFLTRILALLAAHVPNAEKSMQNRLKPMSWETVIDVASTHGVITAELAEHVRSRMAALYPPTQPSVTHRVARLASTKGQLSARLSELDSSLLDPPGQDFQDKRKRKSEKHEASAETSPGVKRQRSEDG
ncbi:hypothetical protein C8Q77DRAFT_1056119 [Trametes polyzona]|nr:hypothetical protein C8Q77DRAFT_1056119 [Trametes polyzona]